MPCCFVLRRGLKTIINLQHPGEHASCGNPLEPESGFTYQPETFMEAGSEYHFVIGSAKQTDYFINKLKFYLWWWSRI